MSEPFLCELRLVSFGFPPRGWAACNGQLLPINQNQALFSLLGTTYGGNGQTNFALPNLQGRVPMHVGGGHNLGQQGGESNHTLSVAELPTHTHAALASGNTASVGSPAGAFWATTSSAAYGPSPGAAMAANAILDTGGGQAHENRAPFLVLNWIIALQGVFPSPN